MYKTYVKRLIDICVSIILLPIYGLIFIITAPIIYMYDKGPVFYNAERLGKNGKIFNMYKFRTMKVNSEDLRNEDGSTYNGEDDPRVTKIGKFLRKNSIDEIPQILNVLKGEMSIVGPRPDLPEHLKKYQKNEIRKLEVKPGITGYNQAYYRNAIEWKERIKNDIYYVDNVSFFMDMKIIFKTITTVLKHKGIYINKEEK